MIALALLLQAASAPPVPPPPKESYLAAVALWRDNAPSEAERRSAIDRAVGMAASGALAEVGIQVIYTKRGSVSRWLTKFDQLKPIIARHVPADLHKSDGLVADCVINDLAYALSSDEIGRVREFFSTVAGKKFWSISGVFHDAMLECYRTTLNLKADYADFLAVGLRPPKPPKPSRPQGNLVY
ncbi:hypothetical protein M9979_10580 [Sphingomonas sp. RP10(2022)]|uniref:Uncharacterized protein n=1 Tax=Sphingomonas liriopis TaxID=2949094 RepID=A0A9X2I037_9SPHN|nr:hypothetical protein [Sphingomonas liriopis]MCP3735315.1 hypothetical protein [Sphingomonas liriopis]